MRQRPPLHQRRIPSRSNRDSRRLRARNEPISRGLRSATGRWLGFPAGRLFHASLERFSFLCEFSSPTRTRLGLFSCTHNDLTEL
jgi:hypothetical protein